MIIKKFKIGKSAYVLILMSVIFSYFQPTITAQTCRAFLVGINKYEPNEPVKKPLCRRVEDVRNLLGCLNDVEAIKGILISRFYFKPGNIHVLTDEEATRDNILSGIETYLIKEAAPGDVCVFYFAGHGSQVKNSKSNEPDKKDETLVPADWYIKGDIRDKELKKLFNRILDKKANLTVMVDACHSGSISRGIPSHPRFRAIPANECDAAEPPDNEKEPAEKGALILSAARDFQKAFEIKCEDGKFYGVFTWALLKIIRSVPIDEPVGNILPRVNALMQSEGINCELKLHDPNIETLSKLKNKSLLGLKPGKDLGIAAGVVKVYGKRITLLAGYAAGIRKNCELQKIPGNENKPAVKVRVTRVYGLSLCEAEVIEGDVGEVKIGDLFEIYKWAVPREARMRVWIPESNFSYKKLLRISREAANLKESGHIQWVDDPTEINPTHIMSWYQAQSSWLIETNDGRVMKLGKRPGADAILKKILSNPPVGSEKPRFFLHLPLSPEIKKIINPEIKYYNDSLEVLSSSRDAHYILVGCFAGDGITYAWVHPNICREKAEAIAMPIRTGWIAVQKEGKSRLKAVIELWDKLLHLVKIRAWMQLSSPPDKGNFPYRLVLKEAKTGEISTKGPLREGEIYGLVLRTYKEKPGKKVKGRYVYVFSIDCDGKGTLLFPPRHRRNSENHFPAVNEFQGQIQLWDKDLFKISEPFGVDTYFLLTTEEPISNPEVLDFSGVRGEPPPGKRYTPLERLLYGLGSGYRGIFPVTYTHWSVQRLPILSEPKDK